jgi:hypothetical protein
VGIDRLVREHGIYLEQRWGWLAELHRRFKRAREYDPKRDFALGDPWCAPYMTTNFLLTRVTYQAAQAARAANYAFLLERLKRFVPEPFARLREGASPYAFPVQSDRKKELINGLYQHGIVASNLWSVPHSNLKATDFPRADALRKRVVGLPVHQELGVEELECIVGAVIDSSV